MNESVNRCIESISYNEWIAVELQLSYIWISKSTSLTTLANSKCQAIIMYQIKSFIDQLKFWNNVKLFFHMGIQNIGHWVASQIGLYGGSNVRKCTILGNQQRLRKAIPDQNGWIFRTVPNGLLHFFWKNILRFFLGTRRHCQKKFCNITF